jgi:TRAP-type mannitol/chloroaromatic compound transport system substrate-binding protein
MGDDIMKRRDFLAGAGVAAATATLAAPAIAQDVRRWRMVSAWPRNLPGPGIAAQMLADRITALSGGRIVVELFGANEIVPGAGVFDAVAEGTAEIYHAVPAYWGSKSKGILLFGSQPLGLGAIEQIGWLNHGGGQALYDEMYGRFGLKPFLCGNSGPQWAGWFRNEIHTVDDLRGLKYRTTGLNSEVCTRLGMAVEAMGGPAMFQAVRGRIRRSASSRSPKTTMRRASASRARPRNAASTSRPMRICRRICARPSPMPRKASTTRC